MNIKLLGGLLVLLTCFGCQSEAPRPPVNPPTTPQGVVFQGQYRIASDPSVIRDQDIYRMSYTGFDPTTERTVICLATSTDGITWQNVPSDGPVNGKILSGQTGTWQERLEGSFLLKTQTGYRLYYSGYPDAGDPAAGFPAALGVAASTDGVNFTLRSEPILSPTPAWYDNDAIYSPTIIRDSQGFRMIYTGHCYSDCPQGAGVFLLSATSPDGIVWEKATEPLRFTNEPGWARNRVAEVHLAPEQGASYTLYVTGGLGEDEKSIIGTATSPSPLGPYTFIEEPLITPTDGTFDEAGALAPSVVWDERGLRLWYFGLNQREEYAIGLVQIGE